ncbi:piggybac transposable element-derived protein 4 [Holotrichia oblita]|uniref:Piggybac transposable element-derived protein 4 n=1 Tax=Holotrichia oblita TaxID=644536 RepID=A0ACB9SQ55_HOLOL|nr:piggybac transposable element-derived protein 4 [Holotrichia oblita]
MPKEITNKKLKKGEVIGKENNGVKVIKWVHKRPVLISSDPNHSATLVSTEKQKRNGDEIFKPRCVIDYNNAKKGVDYSDQMSSYHTSVRKSLKWYRKVVFQLILGTTVVNAWVIYNIIAPLKMGILEFRKQLAEQLVAFNEEESSHRPALVPKKGGIPLSNQKDLAEKEESHVEAVTRNFEKPSVVVKVTKEFCVLQVSAMIVKTCLGLVRVLQ